MARYFSYTKIDTFRQCPFRYKLNYINKIKENMDNNMHIQKGSLVHLLLERKINNETDMNDPELLDILQKLAKEDIMKILKATKKFVEGKFFNSLDFEQGTAEQFFYLDKNLVPCSKPNMFMSGKIDYIELKDEYALIIDWKTGKKTLKEIQQYKADDLQLDIYALWALQKYEDIRDVHAMLYYVESEIADEKVYSREMLPKLKENIASKIDEIESTKKFERKLGPLCDYCFYYNPYCIGDK